MTATSNIMISSGGNQLKNPDDLIRPTTLNLDMKQVRFKDRTSGSEIQNHRVHVCSLYPDSNRPSPRQFVDFRTYTPMALNTNEAKKVREFELQHNPTKTAMELNSCLEHRAVSTLVTTRE